MDYEFDPAKDERNRRRHGLGLADFAGFDAEPLIVEDDRFDYGERRYRAFGRIDGHAYCLVYTVRGRKLRLISFRRAHDEEIRRYEQR